MELSQAAFDSFKAKADELDKLLALVEYQQTVRTKVEDIRNEAVILDGIFKEVQDENTRLKSKLQEAEFREVHMNRNLAYYEEAKKGSSKKSKKSKKKKK